MSVHNVCGSAFAMFFNRVKIQLHKKSEITITVPEICAILGWNKEAPVLIMIYIMHIDMYN